jgi:hypothetical protein
MTFKQLRQLFFDYWWIALGGILLIALVVWIFSGGGESKKEEQLETNIDTHKGEANVIGNLVTNQQQAVNNAANTTNQAVGDLGNSVNRDSSTFNGNSTDRFCRRFCHDSTCIEWRKSHECG